MTPEQKKGEHGTVETVVVNGVVTNKVDVKTDKHAAGVGGKTIDEMTKVEIMSALDYAHVSYSPAESKADLFEKLPK